MNPDDINEASLQINPDDVRCEIKYSDDLKTVQTQTIKVITGMISIRIPRKTQAEERKRLRKIIHHFKRYIMFRQDYAKYAWKKFKKKYLPKLRMEKRRGYKGKGCRNRNLRN